MKTLAILCGFLFVLAGCGVEKEVEPVSSSGKQEEINVDATSGDVMFDVKEVSPLMFQYTVKNTSEKELTLNFTSSQRFDYSIKNDKGEEVFLFSSVTSFLQVVGKEIIPVGDQLTYDINLKEINLSKGNYTLTVWMTPKSGEAYSTSIAFSVE